MKNLFDLFQQAVDFNHKAGNKLHEYNTLDYWRSLENQCKLMVEESLKGLEASQMNNSLESADALADEFFVWAWKVEQHRKAGFDVEAIIQAVIDNNAKKVFNSFYECCEAKEKLEERFDEEFFIETSVYNGLPFYTIRDSNHKIRKPIDFEKVSLEQYLP